MTIDWDYEILMRARRSRAEGDQRSSWDGGHWWDPGEIKLREERESERRRNRGGWEWQRGRWLVGIYTCFSFLIGLPCLTRVPWKRERKNWRTEQIETGRQWVTVHKRFWAINASDSMGLMGQRMLDRLSLNYTFYLFELFFGCIMIFRFGETWKIT